jgi:hypothetical protein
MHQSVHANPVLLGQAGLELTEELRPEPSRRPAAEAAVDRLPGAVALGEVAPGDPGVEDEENAVEDPAMIMRGAAVPTLGREQRLEEGPLRIGELVATGNHHTTDLQH